MATPAYGTQGAASQSAGATGLASIGLPTRANGNKLVAICTSKNNDVHNWSGTGWTKKDQVNAGASFTISMAECIVDGTEQAPSVSWTNSNACAARIWVYTGNANESIFASASHGSNNGVGTTQSKTGYNSTQPDSLFLYISATATGSPLATPAGWTENSDSTFATAGIEITVGSIAVPTVGTPSGDISVTGGNARWVMWQIELRSPGLPILSVTGTADNGTYDLGSTLVNTPISHQFTITNTGYGADILGTLLISGTGWSISGVDNPSGSGIAVSGTATVTVIGNFATSGAKTGILTIPSNDVATPYVINLTANALAGGTIDGLMLTGIS